MVMVVSKPSDHAMVSKYGFGRVIFVGVSILKYD
jgi:hypothetical protein